MSRYDELTPILYRYRRWDWFTIGQEDAESYDDIETVEEMLQLHRDTSRWFFPQTQREEEDYRRGWLTRRGAGVQSA